MKKNWLTGRVTGFDPIPRLAHIFALALALFIAPGAWADITKNNPVTGEQETYDYQYVGSGTWTASEWENANGEPPTAAPGTDNSGLWGPMLVDKAASISVTKLNGWELQLGVFGGANVTVGQLGFWTGNIPCFGAVDDASHLTISATTGNNWNNTVKFYVANSSGITFTSAFAPANPNGTGNIHYYLKGSGSVAYSSTLGGAVGHVIKQADVTLSGTTRVASKTLVSFTSTTKTFTADAAIKVYGTDGTTLEETVNLATVRQAGVAIASATSNLTTEDNVGSCEIVQCTDGIVLYYIDGAAFQPKTYKPSISVNFCDGNNPLTTAADVGLGAYAVPGTSWNNMLSSGGNSSVFSTPLSTIYGIDSTGAQTLIPNASVTISATRGSWGCSSLVAGSDVRHGYADDNNTYPTPTASISGIPYYQYRVIVYTATDAANTAFGYITVNGTDYTYENSVLAEGTAAWGASGAANTAEALAEGVNVLVSPVTSGSTATVVGHNGGGRGCIAAIQIVEVPKTAGEGELVINVSGDTTYAVGADATYTTVYVTGVGTLSFSGEGTITTSTLNIGNGVTMPMDTTHLSPTTVTGSGTVVYDGVIPPTDKGWTDSANWKGTVWVKNKSEFNAVVPGTLENANSTLRLTGVSGYFNSSGNTAVSAGTLELVDDGDTKAFTVANGFSQNGITKFAKLAGDGTLTQSNHDIFQRYVFTDPSAFTGNIDIPAGTGTLGNGGNRPLRVILGNTTEDSGCGTITIASGTTATIAVGKTWSVANKIVVNGTLNVNGTLASESTTAAVSGSGTVVFTGRLPTPTTDAWWKNANWTGTVQIDSLTGFIGTGTGTVLAPNDYGNTGSTLELKNCSGWLPVNDECSVPLSIAGTLTINNGYSGVESAFTIDHLKGNGQITCNGSAPTVLIYVREWSGYTGKVKMDNKMMVFGADTITTSDLASGTIYICEGAVVTNRNTYHWEPAAKMKVNGTFAVTSRAGWTDSKPLELGANGVVNFIGSGVDDHAYNFSNITGSGKILFSNGTGYSMLPSDASKMPSTDVAVVNDNTASFVVLTCTGTTTIGTLSGSGKFDSRYNTSTTRRLAVVQSADSEWSGTFVNEDRVGGMDVSTKSGATAKTLTLSGTQTASNELVVQAATETTDAGSVNLTGTWVGNTTVSGTFGGTGTLTGDLTFSDGATFKAFATDADGLSVSGTVTCPAEGTVTLDVSDLTLTADVALLTASDLNKDEFTLTGAPENSTLEVVGGVLTLKLPVTITVPSVDNATATATIGDTPIVLDANGQAAVPAGSVVTVTYTANEGYELSGTAQYTIDTASATTFDITDTATVEYVASITVDDVTNRYTSLQKAISEATSGQSVTLLANVALTSTITIDKDLTLDLNGYTITASGINAITTSGALTVEGSSGSVSVTLGNSVVLTSSAATLTVSGGATLSPTPTTNVVSHRVKTVTEDGTTTYSVEAIPGTTFTVY